MEALNAKLGDALVQQCECDRPGQRRVLHRTTTHSMPHDIRTGATVCLLVACLLSAFRTTAHGQGVLGDSTSFPIYLTISGGIAAGSYQSGINWALLHAIRRSENPGWRADHDIGSRPLALAGMTGASAGNINAVLSAMEYCRAIAEPDPRKSLFWRVWIPTGFTAMLGENDTPIEESDDYGLFDRKFFVQRHLSELQKFGSTARDTLRQGCRVPLGITVTKLLPARHDVVEGLEVPVTRHALTFAFTTETRHVRQGERFRFVDEATAAGKEHFGHRIWLRSSDSAGLTIDNLYEGIAASSAFPVAFAPMKLRYGLDPGCRRRSACTDTTALFVDGGAFDNNPVDVMVGLRRANSARPATRSLLLYIDQDERRGGEPAEDSLPQDSLPRGQLGVRGLMQLVSGFYSASRSYELQSLSKSFALDSAAYDLPNHPIRVSDRKYPVVGVELGAFAAFLGRVFREYDFYAGIYDGIHTIAEQLAFARTQSPGNSAPADTTLARAVRALIVDTMFIAHEVDRQLLLQLWRGEFGEESWRPASVGRLRPDSIIDRERLTLFSAMARASVAMAAREDTATVVVPCGDPVLGGYLCESNFGEFVDAVRSKEARDAADRIADDCERQHTSDMDCTVDEDFELIRDNREHGLYLLVTRAILRLRANERALKNSKATPIVVGIAGLAFNQWTLSQRTGPEMQASTIPRLRWIRCVRCIVVPYRFTVMAGTSGYEVDYYRPAWRYKPGWAVTSTLTPFVYHRPRRDQSISGVPAGVEADLPWSYYSVGVGWMKQDAIPFLLEAVEVQARLFAPYGPSPFAQQAEKRHHIGFDLTAQLLAGRLQAGVRVMPDNWGDASRRTARYFGGPSTLSDGAGLAVMLSIPDLPGLAYWLGP